jgi:hypothetical protein
MLNPNIQTIELGINKVRNYDKLHIKQYDKNLREFRFLFIENNEIITIPSGYTAKFQATKPDGTIVFDNCTIENSNTVVYRPKESLSSSAITGIVKAEIGFYKSSSKTESDGLIQPVTFDIILEPSAMNRDRVISSDNFNALTVAINTVEGLVLSVQTAVDDVNSALLEIQQSLSQLSTLNQQVTDAEKLRKLNENQREQNEENRIAAELLRPNYYYLTQAEYDALPLSQKEDHSKLYEITDNDGELPNELQNLIIEAQEATEAAWQAASATLPDIGVPGTYNKVTTDEKGRIKTGTKETTISGLGITDVYTKEEVDASKQSKSNIVQTDTVNETAKYPSSAVTYAHGQSINSLNESLNSYYKTDFNQLTDANLAVKQGTYSFNPLTANADGGYGTITVDIGGNGLWIFQTKKNTDGTIRYREKINEGSWATWRDDNFKAIINLSNTFISSIKSGVTIIDKNIVKKGNSIQFYITIRLSSVANNDVLFKISHLPISYYQIFKLRSTLTPHNDAPNTTIWITNSGDVKIYTTETLANDYYLAGEFTCI